MKRILLKQETLDKIEKLKKAYNIKKDTTYIENIVNEKYEWHFNIYEQMIKSLKNDGNSIK